MTCGGSGLSLTWMPMAFISALPIASEVARTELPEVHGPVDGRGEPGAGPDLRVARIDRRRAARAVLRHQGESLLRVEVPLREVRLVRTFGLVVDRVVHRLEAGGERPVDRVDDRLAVDRHRDRLAEPRRAEELVRRAARHARSRGGVAFAHFDGIWLNVIPGVLFSGAR